MMLFWHGFFQDIAGGTPAMSHPAGALPLPIGTQEHVFHLANPRSEAGDAGKYGGCAQILPQNGW